VVCADVNAEAAQETAIEVAQEGGTIFATQALDLASREGSENMVTVAIEQFGQIDILYNNAAMANFEWFDDLDFEGFRKNTRDELDIVFHGCKAVWRHFRERRSGVIVNMASVSGMICYEVIPGLSHSTAKAGVIGMTRHLAMEGAKDNIRVNAISPGLILTNQSHALFEDPDWRKKMLDKIMLDRPGRPDDVAAAATFLASDEASWITGANLPVDGGTTAW
jgi:NAD(P)-dependent dehydrogenase (short-subunit alcohol dehydrogenase family)